MHLGEDDILHDEYVVQNSVPDASQEYAPPPAPRTGCLPDVDADKGDSNPGGLQGQPRW